MHNEDAPQRVPLQVGLLASQEEGFWSGRPVPVYSRATRADTGGGASFSSAKR